MVTHFFSKSHQSAREGLQPFGNPHLQMQVKGMLPSTSYNAGTFGHITLAQRKPMHSNIISFCGTTFNWHCILHAIECLFCPENRCTSPSGDLEPLWNLSDPKTKHSVTELMRKSRKNAPQSVGMAIPTEWCKAYGAYERSS